jgi:hypothetical protein
VVKSRVGAGCSACHALKCEGVDAV